MCLVISSGAMLQSAKSLFCKTNGQRIATRGGIDGVQCQNLSDLKSICTVAGTAPDASCGSVAHSVCKVDAFDPLCYGNTNYDDVRAAACESDPSVSSSCPVVNVCLDNPFDAVCIGDNDYDADRESICRTGSNEPHCLDIIIRGLRC